jgi:serine/threonine protein phosphatase PrpC
MQTITLSAAGGTDPGLQREVNEDRFHVDVARGLFLLVDGIGGQAAGGKAADVALTMLRTRLERETGPTADRVREAITIANNEIHRVAALRPEWAGMACVLTVALVREHVVTIGHVGDTRLYKLRDEGIEKVTRDHSPVGEREDSDEISEIEAMRHPRRNEVYRDVGSEPRAQTDPDFIDLIEIPFEPDAALLLCSDGLTDLVESATINQVVTELAGRPQEVVNALVDAANDAGGKDNVTVIYVEGEWFAASRARARAAAVAAREATKGSESARRPAALHVQASAGPQRKRLTTAQRVARSALVALLAITIAAALILWRPAVLTRWSPSWMVPAPVAVEAPGSSFSPSGVVVVRRTESIAEALGRAQPGWQVVVEPGEYRERLVLKDGVRVISRVPRGATIRLPGAASEADPAVVAADISNAEFVGFRIVGDAATPLGTGVLVKGSHVSIVDVEITGALTVAIDLIEMAGGGVTGSDIHDNPGPALAIRSGASPRITHNVFARNGLSERTRASLIIEADAEPSIVGNVFQGMTPKVFQALGGAARLSAMRENWFPDGPVPRTATSASPRGRQGR